MLSFNVIRCIRFPVYTSEHVLGSRNVLSLCFLVITVVRLIPTIYGYLARSYTYFAETPSAY